MSSASSAVKGETGVFKTLPVADRIYRETELPESCAGYARDTITLGWEERQKAHGRRRSDGGVEFGTSLSRGMLLRAGHCLVLDPPRLVVDIVERPEPVFVIEPQTCPTGDCLRITSATAISR